jgi:CubicO group peptidase (beta-lactamase class C family)
MNINISEKFSKEAEKTVNQHFNDIVVITDNTLVVDWHNGKDKVNFIFSCTKSIISLLFGILLENNKKIKLDDPVANHISLLQKFGQKYQNITIRNLLSMTSGIEWCDMRSNFDYNRMVKNNWLEYVISKEIISSKIGQFNYCDGNSLLLSAIITEYSGLSSHEYAKQFLFKPLEIKKTKWKEQNGITMGGTGLHMFSLDLAKIGNLVIQNGIHENEKIIDPKWIKIMSSIQSNGYPEWFGNYGLHWWVSKKETNKNIDMFYALGAHGQYLFIIPKKRASICIRKKVGKIKDMFLPIEFLFNKIIPNI